jgi:hypothetical protein
MSNKKRFLEVYSKVNKITLNEQENDQYQETEFIDSVKDEIIDDFSRDTKMFREGVLQKIQINSARLGDFNLELVENDNIILENTANTQLQYNAIYMGTVKEVPFTVTVPFMVDVEYHYTGERVEFFNRIYHSPQEISVELMQQ